MNARSPAPLTSLFSDAAFTPIIRSRLAPPRINGAVVQRDGILPALARGAPLTLIVGPPGSGKTLLCAAWRKQLVATGHAVAWFNLGPEDDESQFEVIVRLPEGTSVSATGTVVESIATRVREIPGVELTLLTLGGDEQFFTFAWGPGVTAMGTGAGSCLC